jgi:hypothetical protein
MLVIYNNTNGIFVNTEKSKSVIRGGYAQMSVCQLVDTRLKITV